MPAPDDAPKPARRWMAVGRSISPDSAAAGTEAARAAMQHPEPKAAIVFASPRHDLPAVLAAINEVTGNLPLAGCTTYGELTSDGFADGSVVVTIIGGEGISAATMAAASAAGRQRDAGAEAAVCTRRLPDTAAKPHRVLMLFTDGQVTRQEEIIRGAYSVVGASMPMVGGAAADDGHDERTYQLYGDQVLTDAVVGVALASEGPFGVAVGHGWRSSGDAMVVTSFREGRVYTLDDQPALDAYLRAAGAPPEAYTDVEVFANLAAVRPIGIQRRAAQEVRSLGRPDFTDRSITGASLAQGAFAWLLESDERSILDTVDRTVAGAFRPLDGAPPVGVLAFSCAHVRLALGCGVHKEGERMVAAIGDTPLAGFYGNGEIARVRGIDGFHNHSLAMLAVG